MSDGNSAARKVVNACVAPVEDLFLESLVVIAGIIAVVVVGIVTGTIDDFYTNVVDLTSNGVQWTEIMRLNPWIWPAGSVVLIYLVATFATMTRRSPRTARLMDLHGRAGSRVSWRPRLLAVGSRVSGAVLREADRR